MINIRIFVSSTFEDLKDYRKEINELIGSWGLVNIAMERFPAHPSPPKSLIDEAINESDLFIGIYAWRYGSKIDEHGKSYIEYEYDLAKEKGLPLIIFLTDENMDWNVNLIDENRAEIKRFREEVKKRQTTIKFFSKKIDLIKKISSSLFTYLYNTERFNNIDETHKAIIQYRQLIIDDFIARRNEIEINEDEENRNWFINEIQRCNVGRVYISRDNTRRKIADWLFKNENPFLFLIGAAGIGKTNFLLTEITYSLLSSCSKNAISNEKQELILFFPLGNYDIEIPFISNLEQYVNKLYLKRKIVSELVLIDLIKTGKSILILDGLDEFIRVRGESQFRNFFVTLNEIIDINKSKIIISCRDHIFERLKNKNIFNNLNLTKVELSKLSNEQVIEAFKIRLGEHHSGYLAIRNIRKLRLFARVPLLLEMMSRMSIESWKKLMQHPNEGRLYDIWFEEIITACANPEELLHFESIDKTKIKLGNIACLMLDKRSDLISDDEIDIKELETLIKRPFGIFIQQTPNEWGFIHDSFREFALARTFATELVTKKYHYLIKTSSFDYVGAETYSYLKDLINDVNNFYSYIKEALAIKIDNQEEWNNLIRNCFEAIGMIGQDEAEQFIDDGLSFIYQASINSKKDSLLNFKTIYNIIRCIERIHPSAPRPYYEFAMGDSWRIKPSRVAYFVYGIRGFHLKEARPGYGPFLYKSEYKSNSPKQLEVSDCFIKVLEKNISHQIKNKENIFLEYNITMALIRWLHIDHIERIRRLLIKLEPQSKGNLFHSFLHFNNPEIFKNCSELFKGMELNYIYINNEMLPLNFVFEEVIFKNPSKTKFENFSNSQFINCKM